MNTLIPLLLAVAAGVALLLILVLVLILAVRAQSSLLTETLKSQHADAAMRQKIELIKMAMEDERLLDVWGEDWPPGLDAAGKKAFLVRNEIMNDLENRYENGLIGERLVRESVTETFDTEAGRLYWEHAEQRRLETSENARSRRFHEIVAETLRQTAPTP